ncbi:Mitochondrial ubiquitin ligase activator of NFKB 1 [Trichoplax sp. H2]|nr:Mitochondrial ubiquitin ligase activator of NFKB 1 [Trichoplax sp. H2]|eukprot:RDD36541.1 Mitochondrial ubiquitin ligase activator of NFKB 1 [Trichoplax sp. H2]
MIDLLPAAGFIGLLASGCYMIYRSKAKEVKLLEGVEYVDLDDSLRSKLTEGKTIEYAAIQGEVYAENQALRGKFSPDTFGVVSNVTIREYSSKYSGTSRSWHDTDKLISSTDYSVPFKLVSSDGDQSIRVSNTKQASGLTLEAVYEHFEPAEGGNVAQYLIDWFRGYQLRGIQTMEKMLKVGTTVTGVGQVVLSSDGEIQLQPPESNGNYYLTRDNLDTLIKQVTSKAKIWRNVCIILTIGAGILAVYALYKKHQRAAEERERIARIARQRRDQSNTTTDEVPVVENPNSDESRLCVVCLTNERDVVLLQCGHVCVCSTCVSQLNLCPMCRQSIDRIVLMYQS